MLLFSKSFLFVFVLLILSAGEAFSEENEPNILTGEYYVTYGSAVNGESCSWFTALSRDGSDGGHINVQFNDYYISGFIAYTMEQGSEGGELAVLFPKDIFVVWDEDSGHGSRINFEFSGSYGPVDPNEDLVQVGGTDDTNWRVYQVRTMGTLSVTDTGCNEHDAFRLAKKNIPDVLNFWKEDGIPDPNECFVSDDVLTYTIFWDNQSDVTFYDCNVIDFLPDGVDYDYMAEFPDLDPNYDIAEHSYNWCIGDVEPDDSGYVTINVTVNDYAEPAGELINTAELWATVYDVNGLNPARCLVAVATETTEVCCWEPADPNIIYVDQNAPLPPTGTSWQTAYTDLQDAIARINKDCVGPYPEIWVADGTYRPGIDEDDSFEIPAGVKVYGGFGGAGVNETGTYQRNFKRYKSILNGYEGYKLSEGEYYYIYNNSVVTMGDETLLDGFTVEQGGEKGIDASGVTSTVKSCVIANNKQRGISCENGNLALHRCQIIANEQHGIWHKGGGCLLKVENSEVHNNGFDGIIIDSSSLIIKNSYIYCNGFGDTNNIFSFYGVNMILPSGSPQIYNNTIVYNKFEGINYSENDPNDAIQADVRNNILWYNNDGGDQYSGQDPNNPAMYNCLSGLDPNFLEDAYHNISCEPNFAYCADPEGTYNFHLAYCSSCIGAGDNSVVDSNDRDMDYEQRIYGTNVDIGADEAYSCDGDLSEDDIFHTCDWFGADGVINLREFGGFAGAWLNSWTDPNDYAMYDIAPAGGDKEIDIDDLHAFAELWLWEACWHKSVRESYEVPVLAAGGTMSLMTEAQIETLETVSLSSAIPLDAVSSEPEQTLYNEDEIILFFEDLWKHDKQLKTAISSADWKKFISAVEAEFYWQETDGITSLKY